MAVDMQTLLHQGLQRGKPGGADALAAAREQVLANARGDVAKDAPSSRAESQPSEDASATPPASADPVGQPPVQTVEGVPLQADDERPEAPAPDDGDDMPLADDESRDEGAGMDAEASDVVADDTADDTDDESEGAQGAERPCETPIEVAGDAVSKSADMDTQAEMGGTNRTVVTSPANKVASPPRRKNQPIATNVKASASPSDKRQVRGVAESALSVVRAAFPTMSYGDAINAYIAWKSGDLSGLSETDAELVRQKAKAEADPLVRVNNTLTALEKKMDRQASAIGELEVYTVFVMLDRLGFRPAGAINTLADVSLDAIKDVPTVMPKLSRQAEEIRRKVEQKKGRPQRNASLPNQDVV